MFVTCFSPIGCPADISSPTTFFLIQMRDLVKSSSTVKQIVDDLYHKCMFDHFGDKYLAYRETWYAAIKQDIHLDFPLHIDFELANSCNYRCSFCPYSLAVESHHVVQLTSGCEVVMVRVSPPTHRPHIPCIPTRMLG